MTFKRLQKYWSIVITVVGVSPVLEVTITFKC
ncbi:MAG: hypothetical protein CM1200mP8_7320 [Chloroflexota bacterium]|nr:MAG: hypothetical protein CM1200mP8_7320 [Chloroflexota bacterium]